MKLFFFISILGIIYSCDVKQGDSSDLFGGGKMNPQTIDWLGVAQPIPSKNIKRKTIKQETKESKTIGEKLLDVSVVVYVYNAKGNLISTGSGAFIKSDMIVTNAHVIDGFTTIIAYRNSDEKKIKLDMYKIDLHHDVAILKTINFKTDKFLKIKTKFPHVGNEIWVSGTPEGLEGTISNGIISAIRKEKPYDFDLFQFTAPISFGSSGGPLVNPNLELIGITVSGIDRNDAQNLNFAVPAKYISHLLDEENN